MRELRGHQLDVNGNMAEVLRFDGVTYAYSGDEKPAVRNVSFSLASGRTLAILGYNESGKTTLLKLVLKQIRPGSGVVELRAPGAPATPAAMTAGERPGAPQWVRSVQIGLSGATLSAAALGALLVAAALLALVALAELGCRIAARPPRPASSPPLRVGFITSEDSPGSALPSRATIEQLICEKMPPPATPAERKAAALAYLRAAHFQMYDGNGTSWGSPEEYLRKKLTVGELSGGQKHLIYLLRELAARPQLLVCDEILCGLDLERKTRVLRILQKQAREDAAAVLYLTVDFASARLMGDELAFMKDGAFLEGPAPTARLLDYPKSRELKEYVDESLRQEAMARGQHLRAEYARMERDS